MEIWTIRVGADNLSYIIRSENGPDALIIDPGYDASPVMGMIDDLSLKVTHVIATHHHDDHVSSIGGIVSHMGAKVAASRYCGERIGGVDIILEDKKKYVLGGVELEVMVTPGHTPGSICIIAGGTHLITGDTLFIGDCGRCDLPGGSLEGMFGSLQRLKALPDHLVVLPGHDYGTRISDTLGNQKRTSGVLLARDLAEFSRL